MGFQVHGGWVNSRAIVYTRAAPGGWDHTVGCLGCWPVWTWPQVAGQLGWATSLWCKAWGSRGGAQQQ